MIVAIDFGTSFSLAAVSALDGTVHFIPDQGGKVLVPSVVFCESNGNYSVGRVGSLSSSVGRRPDVEHSKRLIGTTKSLLLDGQFLSPQLASSLIIRSLRQNVEDSLGVYPTRCMTAYPANFSIAQQNALLEAFTMAGLSVMRMVGEPNIAAILIANLRRDVEATYLVVDLGGGTFDVAVVEYGDLICEIRAVGGDNDLGGVDYDEALAAEALARIANEFEVDAHEVDRNVLLHEAQRVKHSLTTRESAGFSFAFEAHAQINYFEWEVSREEFRLLTAPLNDRVRQVVSTALSESYAVQVDAVIFTGQGTRIFTIAEVISTLNLPADIIDTYREDAVARGLATYSQVLSGISDGEVPLLLDLSHRRIGLRLSGRERYGSRKDGWFYRADKVLGTQSDIETLIEKFTIVPTKKSTAVVFEGRPHSDIDLVLVEESQAALGESVIGHICLEAEGPSHMLELEVDIDANGIVVLFVTNKEARMLAPVQVNQLFRQVEGLPLHRYAQLLCDDWSILPVTPLSSTEIVRLRLQDAERGLTQSRAIQLVEDLSSKEANFRRLDEEEIASGRDRQIGLGRQWAMAVADYAFARARVLATIGKEIESFEAYIKALTYCGFSRNWRAQDEILVELERVGFSGGVSTRTAVTHVLDQYLSCLSEEVVVSDDDPFELSLQVARDLNSRLQSNRPIGTSETEGRLGRRRRRDRR